MLAKAFYKPDDVLYTCLPLFHMNALYVSLPSSLAAGSPLALGKRFSASGFWDEIRKYGGTVFNALGAMIPILMKQPEKPDDQDNPIRLVLSAACPAVLWEKFEQRFDLKIVWYQNDQRLMDTIRNLECGPDIETNPVDGLGG